MKQRKIIFVLFFIALSLQHNIFAQCRPLNQWGPFQGYNTTTNSVTLNWNYNALYADESFRVFKRSSINAAWADAFPNNFNIDDGTATVEGLAAFTTYYFQIRRYCNGTYLDAIDGGSITTNQSGYTINPMSFCFGYWAGFTGYSVSNTQIQVYWSYHSQQDAGAVFKVYYRIRDFYGSTNVWSSPIEVSSTDNAVVSSLQPSTSYEVMIEKYCPGNASPKVSYTGKIVTNATQTYNYYGPVASVSNITQTTAKITYTNYALILPDWYISGYNVFVAEVGGSWKKVGTGPGCTNLYAANNTKLLSSSCGAETRIANATGLKPNTDYQYVVEEAFVANGSLTSNRNNYIYSYTGTFSTLSYPNGSCNCTNGASASGDITAAAVTNANDSLFYCNQIKDNSKITLNTTTNPIKKVIYKAQSVLLGTGFSTDVKGNNYLLFNAFNPAGCASSRPVTTAAYSNNINTLVISQNPEVNQIVTGKFNIAPNPTNGIFNIQLTALDEVIRQVTVFDLSGRLMYQHTSGKTIVDINKLGNGMYIYKVNTNKGNYTGKLLKQ